MRSVFLIKFNVDGNPFLYKELDSAQRIRVLSTAEFIASGRLTAVPTLRRDYSLVCVVYPPEHGEPYMYGFTKLLPLDELSHFQAKMTTGSKINWYALPNTTFRLS